MLNKKFCLLMLVMTLVFGMMIAGCDDSGGGEKDTWTVVTSMKQLNGRWRGGYSEEKTNEGITSKTDAEALITITAIDDKTGKLSGTIKTTITFSGNGINEAWPFLKNMLTETSEEEEGIILFFNDAQHSMTATQTYTDDTIILSDMKGAQINQDGTKLKQPATEDSPEIIYKKL